MFEENNDTLLLEALKTGKNDALSQCYTRYRVRLTIYAMSILGNEYDAQDLVQDFFVDFQQKQLFLTIGTSLKSFLYTAIKNRCLNRIRDDENRQRILKTIAPPEYQPPEEPQIDRRRLQEKISSTISDIAPQSSKIFELAYYKDMNREQIAKTLGISPNTVKNQLLRAVKIVRANFSKKN